MLKYIYKLYKNWKKIYFEYLYIPVSDKENNIVGITLQITNTTTQSTVKNELTQQKLMLEEVYNQSPDALILVSVSTEKVIFYNWNICTKLSEKWK